MAAFTAKDPDDREAFDTRISRSRTSPEITLRAVTLDGHLVGSIASRALALFLATVPDRPIYARAAGDNVRSLAVLQKAGFVIVGTETSYANARRSEIEETLLRLDESSPGARMADLR